MTVLYPYGCSHTVDKLAVKVCGGRGAPLIADEE
jgi:hypothetical protein